MSEISQPNDKAQHILQSAGDAFLRYGIRRTSMQDIAQAAGISRAALYLHFKNKEDIYRSLVRQYFDNACAAVRAVSDQGQSVEAQLLARLVAQNAGFVEVYFASPHVEDLLDIKRAAAGEEVAAGEEKLIALFADWLESQGKLGAIDYARYGSAHEISKMLQSAVHGIKEGCSDLDEYNSALARFVAMFAKALTS